MQSVERNFVLFKTDLFLFQQNEADIDWWFVGGDCAGWFYARLLPVDRIGRFCDPVMEDWGWTFAVSVDDVRVWVNVWGFKVENCWLFGLEPKNRFFRRLAPEAMSRATETLCDAFESIMSDDPRILKHQWFADNPFDLSLNEF